MLFGHEKQRICEGESSQMWGDKDWSSWSSGWVACYLWLPESIQDQPATHDALKASRTMAETEVGVTIRLRKLQEAMGKPLEVSTRVGTEFTTIITVIIFFGCRGVGYVCHGTPVAGRRQLEWVGSVPLPYRLQESNSDHQTWYQPPLTNEPSCWANNNTYFNWMVAPQKRSRK